MEIEIKNLADCREHLSLVSEWLWREWNSDDGRSVKDVEYRTEHCLEKDRVPMTFVALFKDKPIGTYSLWTNDLKTRQDLTPWLSVLYVVPEMRGKGLGTLLQQHAISQAKKLKYESLYLITDHVGYYEKAGWVFLETAPLRDGRRTRIYRYLLKDKPNNVPDID
ncbi:MAG TPA: GNAT family N-acetyltransferase [Candidatus Paceibacterota bacterium]|nr:GNAT family N-acetyltransferase [Candidatus Paceibacterota bacterium]